MEILLILFLGYAFLYGGFEAVGGFFATITMLVLGGVALALVIGASFELIEASLIWLKSHQWVKLVFGSTFIIWSIVEEFRR